MLPRVLIKRASLWSRILAVAASCAWPLSALAEPLLGVCGGNSMERVVAFERWLGRPVDVILCTVDFQKWENYRYAEWLSKTVYGARGNRRLVYDVPIIITGARTAPATPIWR